LALNKAYNLLELGRVALL